MTEKRELLIADLRHFANKSTCIGCLLDAECDKTDCLMSRAAVEIEIAQKSAAVAERELRQALENHARAQQIWERTIAFLESKMPLPCDGGCRYAKPDGVCGLLRRRRQNGRYCTEYIERDDKIGGL